MEKGFGKIEKICLVLLFQAALLAMSSVSNAIDYSRRKTEEQNFATLLQIKKDTPELFEQAAKYRFSIFNILEEQEGLEERLDKIPAYQELMSHKTSGLQLHVVPLKAVTATSVRVSDAAMTDWKNHLRNLARDILPQDQGSLTQLLIDELKGFDRQSPNGIATGLVQSLPEDLRKQAFRIIEPSQKIEFLKNHLPPKLPDSFKAKLYGFIPGEKSEVVLEQLKQLYDKEAKIKKLIELHLILQNDQGEASHTLQVAIGRIESLQEKDLIYYSDRDTLSQGLSALEKNFEEKKLISRTFASQKKQFQKEIHSNLKKFAEHTEQVSEASASGLFLKEQPLKQALFRGCAGSDCSTKLSFAFPNDPHERVFFVYDDQGTLKGYVSGTIVKQNEHRAFYVHTINGPGLSATDTQVILDTFHYSRKNLEVESILLPEESRLEDLINFSEIRTVIKKQVDGKQGVPIQYQDPQIRTEIEKFQTAHNKAQYDHIAKNKFGISYHPSLALTNLKVEKKIVKFEHQALPPISRDEVLSYALDLYFQSRAHGDPLDLHILRELPQWDEAIFRQIINAIESTQVFSLEEYIQNVRTLLEKHHINFEQAMRRYSARLTENEELINRSFLSKWSEALENKYQLKYSKETKRAILARYRNVGLKTLSKLFENPERKSVRSFEEEIQTFLKQRSLGPEVLIEYANHFAHGLVVCPDYLKAANLDKVARYVALSCRENLSFCQQMLEELSFHLLGYLGQGHKLSEPTLVALVDAMVREMKSSRDTIFAEQIGRVLVRVDVESAGKSSSYLKKLIEGIVEQKEIPSQNMLLKLLGKAQIQDETTLELLLTMLNSDLPRNREVAYSYFVNYPPHSQKVRDEIMKAASRETLSPYRDALLNALTNSEKKSGCELATALDELLHLSFSAGPHPHSKGRE